MSTPVTGQFDAAMEADWRTFRASLADALASAPPGSRAMVRALPGMLPGDEFLWSEVHREADRLVVTIPSNTYLPEELRLSPPAMARLRGMGLRRAHSSADYQRDLPIGHVDEAAAIVCVALQECFGVLHPWCLETFGAGPATVDEPFIELSPVPLGVLPDDDLHLRHLLGEAIGMLPEEVNITPGEHSCTVWTDTAMVAISIDPETPVVVLRAWVLRQIQRPATARRMANDLNQRYRGITFTVEEDAVVAETRLSAYPFTAWHFLPAAHRMLSVVTEAAEGLLRQVGGQSFASTVADDLRGGNDGTIDA